MFFVRALRKWQVICGMGGGRGRGTEGGVDRRSRFGVLRPCVIAFVSVFLCVSVCIFVF